MAFHCNDCAAPNVQNKRHSFHRGCDNQQTNYDGPNLPNASRHTDNQQGKGTPIA